VPLPLAAPHVCAPRSAFRPLLHDPDLLVRQAIEFVHQGVDSDGYIARVGRGGRGVPRLALEQHHAGGGARRRRGEAIRPDLEVGGKDQAGEWTGWTNAVSSAAMFDLASGAPQVVGLLHDLSLPYPAGTPGAELLSCRPVLLERHGLEHLLADHPERQTELPAHWATIRRAVESPDIVSRDLTYKSRMGHWTVSLAAVVEGLPGRYMVVVISLAAPDVPGEHTYHQVITAHPARRGYFYRRDVIKPRWMETKTTAGD